MPAKKSHRMNPLPYREMMRKREDAIAAASLRLIIGERLEVTLQGRPVITLGSVFSPRRDKYFLQSHAGRIYFESPTKAAEAAVDQFGYEALLAAR